MFTYGIISLIQIIFLPGFITILLIRYRGNITTLILTSFSMSLIINYFLVLTLVLIGWYTPNIVLGIFILELALLYYLLAIRKISILEKNSPQVPLPRTWWLTLLIAIAILSLIPYLSFLWNNPQQIFSHRDSVLNWNRWAMDWYKGILPLKTWSYPQLLPANWSMTYKMMGNDQVQGFAKFLAPLFPLAIFLGLFELGFRHRKPGYIAAIPFCAYLLWKLVGLQGSFNYADVPATFLGFLAIYLLLIPNNKNLWLGVVTACGCALTKQMGIYLLLIYPLLAYWIVLKPNKAPATRFIIWAYLWSVIIVAPWYIYKLIQVHSGIETATSPNLSLNMAHNTLGQLKYVFFYFNLFLGNNWRWVSSAYLLLALYGIKQDRNIRVLFLAFIPLLAIWFFKYSYDSRNFALFLMVLGIASGFGIAKLFVALEQVMSYCNKSLLWTVGIGLAAIMITGTTYLYPAKYLMARQDRLAITTVGNVKVNFALYNYFRTNKIANIITNLQSFAALPMIKDHIIVTNYVDLNDLRKIADTHKIGYIFIGKYNMMAQYLARREGYNMQMINVALYQKLYGNNNKVNNYISKNILNLFANTKIIFNDNGYLFAKVIST